MGEERQGAFWAIVCPFVPLVIIGWSLSVLIVGISLLLLITGVTDQTPILVANILLLSPIAVLSGITLRKCD